MGNLDGTVPLVRTPVGVQSLQPILNVLWKEIAATGWSGYVHYDLAQTPDTEDLLTPCRLYDPATQVVLMTELVHMHGVRRAPTTAAMILTMPEGDLSLLAAYERSQGPTG